MASANLIYRAGNVRSYDYIYQTISLNFFNKKENIPARLRLLKKNLILKHCI